MRDESAGSPADDGGPLSQTRRHLLGFALLSGTSPSSYDGRGQRVSPALMKRARGECVCVCVCVCREMSV